MEDEQGYVSHLVDIQTALKHLGGSFERVVVERAFSLWRSDADIEAHYNALREKWQHEVEEEEMRTRAAEHKEGTNIGSNHGTKGPSTSRQPRFIVG